MVVVVLGWCVGLHEASKERNKSSDHFYIFSTCLHHVFYLGWLGLGILALSLETTRISVGQGKAATFSSK